MARPNYGPQAQKRASRLLETLLTFANHGLETSELLQSKIEVQWQTEQRLVVRTKIRYLEALTAKDPYPGHLSKSQIKEALKRLQDFITILEDNRTSTQGSDNWHFTLQLWYSRLEITANLERLNEVWQQNRPLKSKQATAAQESGIPQTTTQPEASNVKKLVEKTIRSPTAAPEASELPTSARSPETSTSSPISAEPDWGQAPDISSAFYGRTTELEMLRTWLITDRCRLVSLLGMGGIGKTSLSVRLTEECQDDFEQVIWRSLRNAPSLPDLLADLLSSLLPGSPQPENQTLDVRLTQLLQQLQHQRCLIVLDNLESILAETVKSGNESGAYRTGYEEYGQLLQLVAKIPHPSCLVLTSREKPKGIAVHERASNPGASNRAAERTGGAVRSLLLSGLGKPEGEAILEDKGIELLPEHLHLLLDRYGGNPLALQIAATTVQELFDGDCTQLFADGSFLFGDIAELLAQQVGRLSALEIQVMQWLAIYRDWVTLAEIEANCWPRQSRVALMEALSGLQRRSLLEKRASQFTQQPVVMEYMTEQLIATMASELLNADSDAAGVSEQSSLGQPKLNCYALTLAQTQAYLRQAQRELILRPVLKELIARLGREQRVEQWLKARLQRLQTPDRTDEARAVSGLDEIRSAEPGYAASNLLKLLIELGADLTGYNCAGLSIWQMHLQDVMLHQVNVAGADFEKTVFAQIAKRLISAEFSPDSQSLATGLESEIILWRIRDWCPMVTYTGHQDLVRCLAFGPDATLVSSSRDGTVRFWDVETGQCLKTLRGHGGEVQALTTGYLMEPPPSEQSSSTITSLSRAIVVTGDDLGMVRIWSHPEGELLQEWSAHQGALQSLSLDSERQRLISSGSDGEIILWQLTSQQRERTIQAQVNWSLACALSPDGRWLAAGVDQTSLKLWSLGEEQTPETSGQANQAARSLTDTAQIWSVAFSPDGQTLITADEAHQLQFWDVSSGQRLRSIEAHQERAWLARPSPDGQKLVSCGDDQMLKLWNAVTAEPLQTLKTYRNAILALAFSSQAHWLASGSEDGHIRVWDSSSGQCLKTLRGHTAVVSAVDWSPHHPAQLASGSDDGTVKLWDGKTGRCLRTFRGHQGWVQAVAFDPLGRFLASSGHDRTIRFWDLRSGECLQTLRGHRDRVKSLSFSTGGEWLASGSDDGDIRIWQIAAKNQWGEHIASCVQVLEGHESWVLSVQFCPPPMEAVDTEPDWQLVSGSRDRTVRFWDAQGNCIRQFEGHGAAVRSVAVHLAGCKVISASADATVRSWDLASGQNLAVLSGHEETVWALAVDPQSGAIASGSNDGSIRVWDGSTAELLRTFSPLRPYEGLNITSAMGLTETQRESLKALGAIEQELTP